MKELARKVKESSKKLLKLNHKTRSEILESLANQLEAKQNEIVEANMIDLENAKKQNLSQAMVDRLKLTPERIMTMAKGVRDVSAQADVVGEFYNEQVNDDGLKVMRQRVPIGVMLMIFESRPNVVIDCAALALKSSNGIILKGGKEALNSNKILGEIITGVLAKFDLSDSVVTLSSYDRKSVQELLSFDQYIDVVIPRGGHGLVEYVYKNALMPVIAHFNGLCHMYVDKEVSKEKALNIILNGKTQRPGVCNAVETLLVHKDVLNEIGDELVSKLHETGTEIRGDQTFIDNVKKNKSEIVLAKDEDWDTEYLANILSIKTVSSLDEAIEHIDKHGSHHSECIISENDDACKKFLTQVDASCVMVNASTRFNDGSQLGLGAELGISTTKLHAYGPMGIEQMTTSRYVVVGDGHVRG